jgi:hypothetical protein
MMRRRNRRDAPIERLNGLGKGRAAIGTGQAPRARKASRHATPHPPASAEEGAPGNHTAMDYKRRTETAISGSVVAQSRLAFLARASAKHRISLNN